MNDLVDRKARSTTDSETDRPKQPGAEPNIAASVPNLTHATGFP